MHLQILAPINASQRQVVEYWAARYADKRPHLYVPHVGRTYIDARQIPRRPSNHADLIRFISQPGGVIWRVFWLHCHDPERYPIFDQHVSRAMKVILGASAEIPKRNSAKAEAYAREYLPFHARFRTRDRRELDKALWSFGKEMKGRHVL
jgi:hypothetical protein